MDDFIYGPDGSSLGTWSDFWSRYGTPEGTWADEPVASETVDGFSGLGSITMGASLFTGAANIYSAYQNAKTKKALYDVQEEMANINQRIAERQAQSVLRQSEFKIAALTLRAGQIKSSQRASLAANGIQLGVGSAAEITAGTDLMKEIDMNTERLNGIMSAWGYRLKGLGYQSEAAEARLKGSSSNPLLAASGEFGRQSARIGTQYYNYRKSGLLGG